MAGNPGTTSEAKPLNPRFHKARPTLYAHTLDAIACLYGRDDWAADAETMRAAVFEEAWDGRWFADQSLRHDGTLQKSAARTETCQYHALWFGAADRDRTEDLWPRLRGA
jgi:hypothetical protein